MMLTMTLAVALALVAFAVVRAARVLALVALTFVFALLTLAFVLALLTLALMLALLCGLSRFVQLAGTGVRLGSLELSISLVDRLEESAAGDGSGRDGIYVTTVFGDSQLAALATDNVLAGFVGVLEPVLHV